MITNWNTICTQIECSEAKLQEFIEKSGLSLLQLKKLQKFTKEWNSLKKQAETFDQYINPVDPIKVKSQFNQDDFRYIWKTWKEYMQEQHGVMMRTRREQMSLDLLAELSENNVDKAIGYLRFAMAHGYRKFFIVDEKAKSTPEKVSNDGSDW
jgi:hypothetical protein